MAEAKAWVIIPKSVNKGTECVLEMQPLVLCKDCKHWNEDDHDCKIKVGHFTAPAYWFYADGEEISDVQKSD